MPLLAALGLLCLAAPSASLAGAQGGLDWTPLSLPSTSAPWPAASAFRPLREASHLRGPRAEPELPAPRESLPAALLVPLLEEEARRAGLELEILRGAPPLLARGSPEALRFARRLLAELEEDAQALAIEVEAVLAPKGAARGERWSARLVSGQEAALGERRRAAFVWDWAVEVAADAGVATPRLGEALHGHTLWLIAWRVEGGRRVHVDGLLDLAELLGIEPFDPRTADLGLLEQPRVQAAQLAFSGTLGPEEELLVELEGLPFEQRAWSLTLRARTSPDVARAEGPGLALLDVAFVGASAPAWVAPDPGPGLAPLVEVEPLGEAFQPLAPASLAAAAGKERSTSKSARTFAPPSWSERLLVVPRADTSTLAAARSLLAAAEAARLESRIVELRQGELRARFPVTRGRPARLVVGEERTRLFGWTAELAPESWMGEPKVGALFDGLVLELASVSGGLDVRARWSASEEPALLERTPRGVGRTELLRRSSTAAAKRLDVARALLLGPAALPPLDVGFAP